MTTPRKRRPLWVRALRILAMLVMLLLVVAVARVIYAFRDRNSGYSLDLKIDPPPANGLQPLRVGFGRVKISPNVSDPAHPVWMAGFSAHRGATKVHDDLWAVACVLDDGHTRLGIVALDAIGFFHDDVIAVRRKLHNDWHINYTVICSTHNHSTPDLLGLWGSTHLKTGVDPKYRAQVIDAAAQALGDAVTGLKPTSVNFIEIPTESQGLVSDGRKPYVFDPNIRLMHFTNPTNGTTIGTLVTWASHPETLWSKNTEITADYPGYLRDVLENGFKYEGNVLEPGLGGTHLYINGAIGGLMTTSPSVTVRNPYLQQDFKDPSHQKAGALGCALASRIIEAIAKPTNSPTNQLALAIHAYTLSMPLANKGYLAAPVLGVIDRGQVRWKQIRTEVALITAGDASIACIPGEIYPEIVNGGIERAPGGDFDIDPVEVPPIRDMMPGKIKFIFGLANDEIGYIIPKSEWDQKPPYLYGANKAPYGEINSCGPEVAPRIHRAFRELCGK